MLSDCIHQHHVFDNYYNIIEYELDADEPDIPLESLEIYQEWHLTGIKYLYI